MKKPTLSKGLIQVYTGNSKGKSTAAFGLAIRAIGQGFKVYIIQFMKGNSYYGELKTFQRLIPDITIKQFGRVCNNPEARQEGECRKCGHCFIKKGQAAAEDRQTAGKALAHAVEVMASGDYDIVILDELNNALYFELLELDPVLKVLQNKPELVELVLTGRNAPPQVIELADLVTEMKVIKHPFEKGIPARRGIEY